MQRVVDCASFRTPGQCVHPAAPRGWARAACIVWQWAVAPSKDPRRVPTGCALREPAGLALEIPQLQPPRDAASPGEQADERHHR